MGFGSVVDTFIGISCDTFCCVVDSEEIVMAEEIISISVRAINPCIECTTFANCKLPCEKQQKWVESGYGYGVFKEVVMTRQEAIDKMAKAGKKAYRGYFYCEPNHPSISDMMEVALNALLEVDK